MTLADSVHARRLKVICRAHAIGNVTQACREHQISRTLFYRWQQRFERYGAAGLYPKPLRGRPGRPSALPLDVQRQVLGLAVAWPTAGPQTLASQLVGQPVPVTASAVYRLLRRAGLGTRRTRLAVLEQHSAQAAGLLTERTGRALRPRARRTHVQARVPGELVCLDLFYIGKLKGVGKVWQITACDAACSYATAQVIVGARAAATARFLRDVLVPEYRAAGWPVRRVLTDNGREFYGPFAATCVRLGIRQTRIQPRHAWTNGFVERLQGTILHEHWRVVFRQRFFRSVAALHCSLSGYLRYYNHRRPHHGYRLRGRTPASVLWGAIHHAS
jgi:transposase InsO family protein